MIKQIIFLLGVVLVLQSCNYSRNISKTGITELSFGSGGGFTGQITEYRLSSKGVLYKNKNYVKRLGLKLTCNIYQEANGLKDLRLNAPDNIYSFIHIKSAMSTNRIVWSISTPNLDSNLIHLYKNLKSITK